LDDYDVYQNIKDWQFSSDPILSNLCTRFLNRDLFRTTFINRPPTQELINSIRSKTMQALQKAQVAVTKKEADYYFKFQTNKTEAYKYRNESIWILDENEAIEFSRAADTKSIIALTKPLVRHYVVHLKSISV